MNVVIKKKGKKEKLEIGEENGNCFEEWIYRNMDEI